MADSRETRESRPKPSGTWVESSFITESPANSRKRRLETVIDDAAKPKLKPKPPTWVTSEFAASESSPSKPLATQRPPPRPKDRSTLHTASGTTTNSFISSNPTPDFKTRKRNQPTSFAAQPTPIFANPKTPQTDPQTRTDDRSTPTAVQIPAFRTSAVAGIPFPGLANSKDTGIIPPPPRIEHKSSGFVVQDDKGFMPLTNLIAPRPFGLVIPAGGKGKNRVASSSEPTISDDPFIDQPFARSAIAAEDIETDAEVFTMRELARGLDISPSKKGRAGSARPGASNFIKGGLAARAFTTITQREKDDALWHHHKTSKLTNNPSLREDLRVNVVEKLQSIGDSVLVRCEVCPADAARSRTALVDGNIQSVDSMRPRLVDLLLSRSGSKGAIHLEAGTTVKLWMPWIEFDLNAASRMSRSALDGDPIDALPRTRSDEGNYAGHKQEEYPLDHSVREVSLSYSKNLAPDLRSRRALLCSRYIVG